MAIRKRVAKKSKSGYTYQVYFDYKDISGITQSHSKSGFTTKKDAVAYENEMMQEIQKYGDLKRNTIITFNETYLEYIKLNKNKYAKSTAQYYAYTFTKYIENTIGKRPMNSLRYKEIQKYFNQLDCTLSNAKNIKKIFNITFKHAMRCSYIYENPMSLVRLDIKVDKASDIEKMEKAKTVTKEQLEFIIKRLEHHSKHTPNKDYDEFNNQAYIVALKIGWYTGLRVSEALGLAKSDFDFVDDSIKVCNRLEYHGLKKTDTYLVSKLKTKASNAVIPLASPLKNILEEWFKINPYDKAVCDIEGDFIHPTTLNSRLRTVTTGTEVEGFHYHMLRHSFTTGIVKKGINPSVAKDLLRHGTIQTTLDTYTHINQDDKVNAIDLLFGEENE